MTFPNINPTKGLTFTSDGRDVVPIWPVDRHAWALATIYATLWQFKGVWRYDQSRGIEYLQKILGHIEPERVLQEIFRRAISRYVDVQLLTVVRDGENITIKFKGPPGSGIDETINVLERPAIDPVVPERIEHAGTEIRIRFSETLNKYATDTIEAWELTGSDVTVTAIAVLGREVRLTLSATPADADRLLYQPGEQPLQSVGRVRVAPFSVSLLAVLETEGGLLLTTEDGLLFVTE